MTKSKEIKPIPTKYKRHIFRSRLEARWAVFFDALGEKWEYEPEGFDLGDGVYYLPDFYLVGLGCYAEVKRESGEFDKVEKFVESTKQSILLCEGIPRAMIFKLCCWQTAEHGNAEGIRYIDVTPYWDVRHDGGFFWMPGYENIDGSYDKCWEDDNPHYMQAVEKANKFDFNY